MSASVTTETKQTHDDEAPQTSTSPTTTSPTPLPTKSPPPFQWRTGARKYPGSPSASSPSPPHRPRRRLLHAPPAQDPPLRRLLLLRNRPRHHRGLPPSLAHRSYNASVPLQYALAMQAQARAKALSSGGPAATARTTATPTPSSTRTTPTRASTTPHRLDARQAPPQARCRRRLRPQQEPRRPLAAQALRQALLLMGFVVPTSSPGSAGATPAVATSTPPSCAWSLSITYVPSFYLNTQKTNPPPVHILRQLPRALARLTPFDDKHTPRDHLITALVTIGEGYHNFHHQFPWTTATPSASTSTTPQSGSSTPASSSASPASSRPSPTTRSARASSPCSSRNSARHRKNSRGPATLTTSPSSTGTLVSIHFPSSLSFNWMVCLAVQEQAQKRPLILVSGFIHDVSDFLEEHPGGRHLLVKMIGKDATTAFFGGVYDHSNAAHNVRAYPSFL
ncbi:delta fatty acid desaturase protein [Salix suchowensis]|nr:delta fatty acid desaturase protein [Salix suchowensis]